MLRRDDGSDGVSTSETIEAIKSSFQYFEAHNIFPYIACVKDFKVQDDIFFNAHKTVYDTTLISVPSDGVLVYVAKHASFLGFSIVTSRKLYVHFGTEWSIIEKGRLFAHEMGHSIGLLHTYARSECSNNPNNQCAEYAGIDSYECEVRGDLVCDTPGDPYQYNHPWPDCTRDGDPQCKDPDDSLYTNIPIDNIMTQFYHGCNESAHFTPGQGRRMRHRLQIDLFDNRIEDEIINDIDISNNQVWVEDVFAASDITVKKGGNLTLNGITLTMNTDKRINIEPGGRLVIDGSIITTNSM